LKPSKRPEPHFFVREAEYEKGFEHYSHTHFSLWNGEKVIGEASTSTFYFERAAKRLRKYLPDIKLICIFRNPIEQIFSGYWHSVDTGWEKLSFEEAITWEEERVNNPKNDYYRDFEPDAYTKRGFYYKYLKMWLSYFPKDQIHVSLFEDLVDEPECVVKSIYKFLQVNDFFIPQNPEKNMNKSSHANHQMSSDTREYLLNLYRGANEKLANLINRNLEAWNR
jgi:hypothetical protein